jgi:hypothetical protein
MLIYSKIRKRIIGEMKRYTEGIFLNYKIKLEGHKFRRALETLFRAVRTLRSSAPANELTRTSNLES